MFILKKLIGPLFFPLSLIIELLLIAAFLNKGRRKLIVSAAGLLYLFSSLPFSYLILRPLESQYQPISASDVKKEIRWVLVLGGGSRDIKALPPEDRLSDGALKRLMEGIRLAGFLPKARLVLSGGNFRGGTPEAVVMYRVARNLGLPSDRIVLEMTSRDTIEEVRFLKGCLGKDPFYLVTSASHMPRAMRMFKRLGTKPIAAPTDFQAVWGSVYVLDFFPQASSLAGTERAFYEYLGLFWGLIRGYV